MTDELSILVVEDEEPILEGLCELFRGAGFRPTPAATGEQALARIAEGGFALIVLDLMIPPPDGLSVLGEVRRAGDQTPVLILTAKGAEDDVVAGLEAGADDYVTKPFGIRELVARVRGLVRRSDGAGRGPRRFSVSGAELDLERLVLKDGTTELRITAREADLLGYLLTNRERVVAREELLTEVWGYRDGSVRTRTVDVHVQQLRAKLKQLPGGEAWVETVRGRGYRFAADPD